MDPIFIIGASLLATSGLVGVTWAQINRLRYALSAERRVARIVARVPATAIEDVKDGQLVKICGVVQLPKWPLLSPLSGRACVYFRATGTRTGDRPFHETDKVPFSIVQGQQEAYVESRGAVQIGAPLQWTAGTFGGWETIHR